MHAPPVPCPQGVSGHGHSAIHTTPALPCYHPTSHRQQQTPARPCSRRRCAPPCGPPHQRPSAALTAMTAGLRRYACFALAYLPTQEGLMPCIISLWDDRIPPCAPMSSIAHMTQCPVSACTLHEIKPAGHTRDAHAPYHGAVGGAACAPGLPLPLLPGLQVRGGGFGVSCGFRIVG